jgi:hypothetical protein
MERLLVAFMAGRLNRVLGEPGARGGMDKPVDWIIRNSGGWYWCGILSLNTQFSSVSLWLSGSAF